MSRSTRILAVALAVIGACAPAAMPSAQTTTTQTSAAAPAKAAPKNECFLSRDINGFNAPDDHTLYIRVGVSQVYRLDLMGDCQDLTFRQALGLESMPGAGPWICSPLDAQVVYRETGIPERCPVTAIHRLSADDLAKLPKRDRP